MRELSLFTGAGGGLLASQILGWTPVCAVENDLYSRARLFERMVAGFLPTIPVEKDVRGFDGTKWRGKVDIVSGGFPCQPHSTASRGRKTADDLWPDMRRIISEVEPTHVFAENVNKKPIDAAADDLAGLGYMVHCARISAAALGSPHRRPRCWLVATHPDDTRQRAKPEHGPSVARLRRAAKMVWAHEATTRVLGGNDGMAHRMDRMRCIGNGQVPIVAAFAWTVLNRGWEQ